MTKILVTGADGFIGSHLVETLVKQGYDVKAFVLYNSFNNWGWIDDCDSDIRDSIEIFSGDIRDPLGVRRAVEGCDIIFHLAALIGIPYSYYSPDTYIDTNIKGTLNILNASKDLNVQKIIHTSTSEVYGSANYVPIDENHPLNAQSPYSASKIGADQLVNSYNLSFDLPVCIVRPFNTYGPRQSARAVIPTIITQINSGKKSIKLGSITPTRDFNFVQDTVDGFMASMNSSKSVGKTINIGSNFEISIKETFNLIKEIMNKEVDILEDTKRIRPPNSEVDRLFSNNELAKNILSWQPKFSGKSGFKEGLKITIKWFCDPKNLDKFKTNIYNV